MKKYPEYLMKILREGRGIDKENIEHDDIIMETSKEASFDLVCSYEGLIGYSSQIKEWVKDIYEIDFDKLEK